MVAVMETMVTYRHYYINIKTSNAVHTTQDPYSHKDACGNNLNSI